MSRHHENVVWESKDGTWNRGFFTRIPCGGSDCEDETHEWCDDFDQASFEWASCGHPTQEEARRSWVGSNPGGSSTISHDPTHPEMLDWIESYEDMAAVLCEEEERRERENPRSRIYTLGGGRWRAYNGPRRTRALAAMQKQHDAARREHVGHRLGGYANMLAPGTEDLAARIAERLKTATPAEIEAYEQADAEHRDALRQRLHKHREDRAQRARRDARFRGYGGYDPHAGQRQREANEREAEVEAYIAERDQAAAARKAAREPAKAPAPKPVAAKKAPPAPAAGGAQGRQPKGIPTGGQFAASTRAESGVSLAAAAQPTAPAPSPTTVASTDDFDTWGNDPWA